MAMRYPEHDPALPVVCFDFDGTLASDTWPSPRLGNLDLECATAMRFYRKQNCEIVVFTARPDEHLPWIRAWCDRHSLPVYEVTNRKPKACLYFDDRAVRWPLCG